METVRTIAATGVSVPVTVAYSASWPEAAAERFSTVSLPEATVSVDPVESASAPDLSEPPDSDGHRCVLGGGIGHNKLLRQAGLRTGKQERLFQRRHDAGGC